MFTRARFEAIVEIGLCSGVPTQLAIGQLLRGAGWSPLNPEGGLSLAFLLGLSAIDTLALIGLMVLLTRAHGESVSELWLGGRPPARELLLGVLLIPVVFVLVVVLLNTLRAIAPGLHNVEVNPLEQLASTPGAAFIFGIIAVVAGGIRVELQRAFLLRRFEQHLGGTTVGVVVLSISFGLGHALQGWDAVIGTGVLGAFWALIYVRRRSVLAPIVSHSGFNALEVLRVATLAA
jgi:membrane protease YdiL (CAAX protease family)